MSGAIILSLCVSVWPHYGPGVGSASKQKWVPGMFLEAKGGQCVGLTTLPPSCADSWNLGASTCWNPQGLSRPVMGLLYLFTGLWCVDRELAWRWSCYNGLTDLRSWLLWSLHRTGNWVHRSLQIAVRYGARMTSRDLDCVTAADVYGWSWTLAR
jgi:hypothetical protein